MVVLSSFVHFILSQCFVLFLKRKLFKLKLSLHMERVEAPNRHVIVPAHFFEILKNLLTHLLLISAVVKLVLG